MLFSYKYVPHKIERMQNFINFIFYQIWCRAPKAGPYNLDLFDANPPLKEIMLSFAFDQTKSGDWFSVQVEAIYLSFSNLTRQEIVQFKRWYQANNEIEKVCSNENGNKTVRYSELCQTNKLISDQLAVFFKGLYSDKLLNLAAMRAKIGEIDDHYKVFVTTNAEGKCPFCGISDLLNEYTSKREAYDHYLPKALYPFNSINFRNLAPACHHCNSSYKTSKDPAYSPKDPIGATRRRAAFYPYGPAEYSIEMKMKLKHSDADNLKPDDVEIEFGPIALLEKINTWKEVYGIEERYKAKLCNKTDGKYWLRQVVEESKRYGLKPDDVLEMRIEQAHSDPYADCNFLRKAFLEACKEAGLF